MQSLNLARHVTNGGATYVQVVEACEAVLSAANTLDTGQSQDMKGGSELLTQMQWELGQMGVLGVGAAFEGQGAPVTATCDFEAFAYQAQVRFPPF